MRTELEQERWTDIGVPRPPNSLKNVKKKHSKQTFPPVCALNKRHKNILSEMDVSGGSSLYQTRSLQGLGDWWQWVLFSKTPGKERESATHVDLAFCQSRGTVTVMRFGGGRWASDVKYHRRIPSGTRPVRTRPGQKALNYIMGLLCEPEESKSLGMGPWNRSQVILMQAWGEVCI